MTSFRIKDIRPNPFRNLEYYPINANKVKALRESLQITGFWDNLVCRLDDHGFPEIAYGHHRLEALRQEYPPEQKVALIVKKLNNDDMLKIMARENMEEWGSNTLVETETVRATLKAYAAGEIHDMPAINPSASRGNRAFAGDLFPSLIKDSEDQKPYNSVVLAEYLGWFKHTLKGESTPDDHRVQIALRSIRMIDAGITKPTDYTGLNVATTRELNQIVGNIHDLVEDEDQAKAETQQAFQMAKNLSAEGRGSKFIADQIRESDVSTKTKPLRAKYSDINHAMLRYAMDVEKLLSDDEPLTKRINMAMNKPKGIETETIERMERVLVGLLKRVTELTKAIDGLRKTH